MLKMEEAQFVCHASNDWPRAFSELKELDAVLRCSICFEFLDTAMMVTKCSHNYCSVCIRRYVGYKLQCPSCREAITVKDLCNNRSLDEIVNLFSSVRSKLLSAVNMTASVSSTRDASVFSKQSDAKSPDNIFTKAKTKSPKCHALRRKNAKRYAIESDSDSDVVLLDEQQSSDSDFEPAIKHNTPRRSPNERKKAAVSEEEKLTEKLSSDAVSPSSAAPVFSFLSPTRVPPPEASTSGSPAPSGKVSCPVCSVCVPKCNINLHLDRCLSAPTKRNASANKRKPLTKYVYSVMSDKEIRKKLSEVGLPTQGDRQTLIKRHQEFTLLYNAQCDALNPKPASTIVQEMIRAGKQRNVVSLTTNSTQHKFKVHKGATSDEVRVAQKSYLHNHKSQFAALVEAARSSKRNAEEQQKNTNLSNSPDNQSQNSAGNGESQPEEVREEEPSTEKIERSQSAASFMLDESSVDAPDIVQCTEQLTSIGDEEDSNMSRKFSQFSNDLQLTQRSLSSCSPSSLEFIPPEIAEDSSEQAATCNSDVSPSCSPVLQSQKSEDLLISEDKSKVPVEVHLSEDKPLDGNLVHAQQKLSKKRKRKNTDFVSESVHQIMNAEEDCGRRRSSRRKITK